MPTNPKQPLENDVVAQSQEIAKTVTLKNSRAKEQPKSRLVEEKGEELSTDIEEPTLNLECKDDSTYKRDKEDHQAKID